MDLSQITAVNGMGLGKMAEIDPNSPITGKLYNKDLKADGTMFEAFLNTAINNINTTNSYLSEAEDEEIKFALGETESTHDLSIALQKASTALQYTVAIRDKVMEAYKELMQIQI